MRSRNLNKDELIDSLITSKIYDQVRKNKLDYQQLKMIRKDVDYNEAYKSIFKTNKDQFQKESNAFINKIDDVLENRIEKIDLKSYNFDQDPDCLYTFNN